MQTIELNIKPTAAGFEIVNGSKVVALITELSPDKYHNYISYGVFVLGRNFGAFNNIPDAMEFIGRELKRTFDALGLNVEFVNEVSNGTDNH